MAKKDGDTLQFPFINKNIKVLRTFLKMSQGDVYDKLGISRQQYSNIESGYAAPSLKHLVKLTEIFGISLDDLCLVDLSGKKNIFNTKTPEKVINSNDTFFDNSNDTFPKLQKRLSNKNELMVPEQQVPVYESVTLQSLESLFSNTLKPNSYLSLPNLPKCDGAVRMWGDTMSPELQSGDLLVYKKVKDLRNGLFLGQIYLLSVELEGEEYIMVQYVEKSDVHESVKLVSKNERYPAKDVPLNSIKALAMIKASVRYRAI